MQKSEVGRERKGRDEGGQSAPEIKHRGLSWTKSGPCVSEGVSGYLRLLMTRLQSECVGQ